MEHGHNGIGGRKRDSRDGWDNRDASPQSFASKKNVLLEFLSKATLIMVGANISCTPSCYCFRVLMFAVDD